MNLDGLTVLITGGTGSLGNAIVRRIMTGEMGKIRKILVFSRDELKQYNMRNQASEDIRTFAIEDLIEFHIGDIRLYDTLLPVLRRADVVINAAALKQVPQCEFFPYEAVRTNIIGPYNIVRGIREHRLDVQKVITISTDKACKPVNVMGMTKALQERLLLAGNADVADTDFMAVRYGNVIASRGSVIPYFKKQIEAGGPITITSPKMTRFLLTLDRAVDVVFEALRGGQRGEILVPQVPSARIIDIARVMIGSRDIEIEEIGIRPGEKIDEILLSEEECLRTSERNGYYVINTILPIAKSTRDFEPVRTSEYTSGEDFISMEELTELLVGAGHLD
jgi:UDP-glucose 4-epimerase